MDYSIEMRDDVAIFQIERPEIRNAINEEVMEGLKLFIEQVKGNNQVRFAVVTASGDRAFCSGGDLSVFHQLKTAADAKPMLQKMGDILYGLAILPVPVISLVNGTAVGGGCEIATACDFRLVNHSAKAGFIQGTLAITTGWGGGNYAFERLSEQRAYEMLLSSTPYTAGQLVEMGWATRSFEGDKWDALQQFIETFSKSHMESIKAYKQIRIRHWQQSNLKERIDQEIETCSLLWESDAHHEAVNRFLSKK